MRPILAFLLAILLASPVPANAASRSLYRIPPAKDAALREFLRLGVDVAGSGTDGSLHVFLTEAERATAEAKGLAPELLPLPSRAPSPAPGAPSAPPGLGDYHNFAETVAEMTAYANAHPTLARLDTLGTSIEGRLILGIKISDNVAVEEAEPEALVVGCHHARELMSVELPLYLMRRLLDGYGADPVLTGLVDTREIWIVPVLNPDGHVYVQQNSGGQSDGWWRKNRRPNGDGTFGVDLNRNYGYLWGHDNQGSSPSSSSEIYRGTGPFSEPETSALRDLMAEHSFRLALSFHSYGQLFLYPWGYEQLDTPDHAVFRALGDSVSAMNGYRSGNPKSGAIYLTNGDMDDWVYGDTITKPRLFGFTFELNTYEQGGFYPNDTLIPATCQLNWGPLVTLLRYADEPRRAIPPPRTSEPSYAAQGATGALLQWSVPSPDPANPTTRHEVRRIDSVTRVLDDAESGLGDWETSGFAWSNARAASGTRSFGSGSANGSTRLLTVAASLNVAAGESLVVNAWWELESFYDYWYAESSTDGGETWTRLHGDRTTNDDPFGKNEGSGITGASGGFLRCAFSLLPISGEQALLRFRVVTDATNALEGLYLDDLTPTARYTGVSLHDTGAPDLEHLIDPAPLTPVDFQVRAVDGEGQAGRWSDRSTYMPGVTGVEESGRAPGSDRLWPNAPNPFNPRTTFRFQVGSGAPGRYRLVLYDVRGRRVAVIAEGVAPDAGPPIDRTVTWDAGGPNRRPLPGGVYLLRLESPQGARERKIVLLP
jgi:hypothetical protein